jgi:hypothetical protein
MLCVRTENRVVSIKSAYVQGFNHAGLSRSLGPGRERIGWRGGSSVLDVDTGLRTMRVTGLSLGIDGSPEGQTGADQSKIFLE